MPKRTFWLMTGAVVGAGTSLWAERRVRRSFEQAAARLQPDALVAEVGRTARQAAESTGDRVRDALSSGRDEMRRREEELWSDLADRGAERDRWLDEEDPPPFRPSRGRQRAGDRRVTNRAGSARRTAKSPLHLGK